MDSYKTYIGDGVYAHSDGFHIVLTTDGMSGSNTIYLEFWMVGELVKYLEILKEAEKARGEK